MSGHIDDRDRSLVVTPHGEMGTGGVTDLGGSNAGGTDMGPAERREMPRRQVANPDDPPVTMARRDRPGTSPAGPYYGGTPGRMAIVQGQVYIVAVILIAQLFLVTTALYELLSGHTGALWGIALASLIGFGVALLVAIWPQSRLRGF